MINALVEDLSDDIDASVSAKAQILGTILQLSRKAGDKVLIFTTSIPTLSYLDRLLKSQRVTHACISGSTQMSVRNEIVAKFEANRYSALIISTKAGGAGINLISANLSLIHI